VRLDPRLLPATGAARRELAGSVALGAVGGGLVVLQAWLLARVVAGAFLGGQALSALASVLVGLGVVAVARAAASFTGDALAARAAGRVRVDLRARLARHLLALGPSYATGERSGELGHTVVRGVEDTDAYVSRYVPQLALAVLVPLLVLAAVLAADPLSALVLAVTFPLVPIFMALLGTLAREQTRRQWLTLARLSARFLESIQGLATLKALGRAKDEADQLADHGERFRAATMSVLRVAFLSALVLELLATLSVAIVAVEVGLRLLYGRLAFREAFFVLVLAPEFFRPLRALGTSFHAGLSGREAADRIFAILGTPPAGSRPAERAASPVVTLAKGPPEIVFDDVCFAYDGAAVPAVEGVSFTAERGGTIALVGATGAGKTTLAHLLLRFLEPGAGAIRANGEPIASLDAEAWRRGVAWVPQRPRLFPGTIADNIRLGRPDAACADVLAAARRAHLDELLRDLPGGLETSVGEDGSGLSGGQLQRVALARAFLKDAPVLVLDEPTSQLDPQTEARLAESMAELRKGRTVLVVAHRLTTVFDADRIVLLSKGRVAEQGTHRELLATGGMYARLVAAYEGAA
jgi:ATP-binding cassette, subfamily C, bacterial CydD